MPDQTKTSSVFTIDIKQNTKTKATFSWDIMASTISTYTLSLIKGTPDELIIHSLLPSFASFKKPYYLFKPFSKNDLGSFII